MAIALRQGVRLAPALGTSTAALWIMGATNLSPWSYLLVLACLLQGLLALAAARAFNALTDAERDAQHVSFWWRNLLTGALHGLVCATFACVVVPELPPAFQSVGALAVLLLGRWISGGGALLRPGATLATVLPAAALIALWAQPGGLRSVIGIAALLFVAGALLWSHREQELLLRRIVLLQARNGLLVKEGVQRSQLIESINRKKTEIISTASHDLRQPVHALGLFVQRLRPGLSEAEQLPLFHQVRSRVSVISDMLGGLLDLSKFDSGGYKVRLERVRLQDVFAEMIELFDDRARRKGLALRAEAPDRDVLTDPALLKQILHNLVSNAIKYTASGEVSIRGTFERRRHLLLEVCDTGIGIPPTHRDEVFLEYYRLPIHRDSPEEGLGIGLALVRRAAMLLGYTLRLESAVGKGSRFGVEIPFRHVTPHVPLDVAAADTRPGELEGNERYTVLVLENDEYANDAMVRLIKDWGYNVHAALSGAKLLARLEADPSLQPHVLVSDMHLGEAMDGLSYALRIRECFQSSPLPVVIVTGDLSREVQHRAAQAQVQLLYKPLQPRLLRAAIRTALENGRRTA